MMEGKKTDLQLEVSSQLHLDLCKGLLLASEPWITLGYTDADFRKVGQANTSAEVIYARLAGQLAGFAYWQPGFMQGGYLRILVVDPAFRGKGVGGALMKEFERR